MSDRTAALATALEAAADAPAILEALARAVWYNARDGAECPEQRIPTLAELAHWEPTAEVAGECGELLAAVLGGAGWRWARLDVAPEADGAVSGFVFAALRLRGDLIGWRPLAEVHARCVTLQKPRPRHPLAPLVADWQTRAPMIVDADHHRRAILPASLREARRDAERLPLGLDRATPLGATDPEQGYLPGLEPPPSLVSPVPWLALYDLTGSGPVQTRGRGAPLAQRLFVEVLTAVHVGDRAPEWITAPPITLRDLFKWCWPRYWDVSKWHKQAREWGRWSGGYDRSKHLEPLRRALLELDNMRIVYAGWERRLIRVDDLPTAATGLDEVVRFNVRQLPGSDRGPMFERAPARRWGVVSAPAWRTTIRLAYLWDEAKRRNNGARIYATRPMVARGPGGVILGADGKPLRDHRGAVVKDWSDPRAVILGADGKPAGAGNPPAYERNPVADRVPQLGPDDLIRLGYDGNLDLQAGTRRKRLHETREALRAKEAAGEVAIEVDSEGWRILETRIVAIPPADG